MDLNKLNSLVVDIRKLLNKIPNEFFTENMNEINEIYNLIDTLNNSVASVVKDPKLANPDALKNIIVSANSLSNKYEKLKTSVQNYNKNR